MTFLERLLSLSEFAMRLSVAKKFVKEVKSDPMVQPYLVNGKIRRSPYNNVHKSSNFTLPVGNAEGKVRGIVITKGKLIRNKFPLEELAHEYGHAQHSAESLRTNNRLLGVIDGVNTGKRQIHDWKKYSATGNPMDTGATIQVKRIQESRRLTRERVATIGGGEALHRAGANGSELGDYFKFINPNPHKGSGPDFHLMHPSYQDGYKANRQADPKTRPGGYQKIRSANFPLQLPPYPR